MFGEGFGTLQDAGSLVSSSKNGQKEGTSKTFLSYVGMGEPELFPKSETVFCTTTRPKRNSFVSLQSSQSTGTLRDNNSQRNTATFSWVSGEGDSQSQASMVSARQGSQSGKSQMLQQNVESKVGTKRNSSNRNFLSKEEIKRMRHREAQKKYKKTLAENLKELRDNKVVADAQIVCLNEQLNNKSHLLGELQNVVTVQNEEIYQLRKILSDVKNCHKDCLCQSCGKSRNQATSTTRKLKLAD